MPEAIKMIYQGGSAEVIEKKSRFIGEIYPIGSEEEAQNIVNQIRKKHYDARHHCFAYVLGEKNEVERCSDDGEPSGTAGRPMLDLRVGAGVHDVLAVVTRYFGGTLLGTGGLVRAYTDSAKLALENCEFSVFTDGVSIVADVDYTNFEEFKYKVNQLNTRLVNEIYADNDEIQGITLNDKFLRVLRITDKEYTDICRIHLICTDEVKDIFVSEITEGFAGKIELDVGDTELIELIYE